MKTVIKTKNKQTEVLSIRISKEVHDRWLDFVEKNKVHRKLTIEGMLIELMDKHNV